MALVGESKVVGKVQDGETIADVSGASEGLGVFVEGRGEVFGTGRTAGLLDGLCDGFRGQEIDG